MMKKDDFYIGYQDQAPDGIRSFTKSRIIAIAVMVVLFASVFALAQMPFKAATFELGKLTELSGTYYNNPYPMLQLEDGGQYKNVLLLGFGKFGAEQGIQDIESESGEELEGRKISLEGTLVYYNGKTLMQLEPDVMGTYQLHGKSDFVRQEEALGEHAFEGEIVDPKCFFGVMKPGKGKIHRSCAVRCISGGIPPLYVVQGADGEEEYYLLAGTNGERINQDILQLVGKPTSITGQLSKVEDWMVLKVNPKTDIQLIERNSSIYLP